MIPRTKTQRGRAAKQFTRAANHVVLPDPDLLPFYSGACRVVSLHVADFYYREMFREVFAPTYRRGLWWWPNPWLRRQFSMVGGRRYQPQEARCLALLLMAEMIRTGDV